VIVVGRVLGLGDIKKKISISALGFSTQAKEKLKKAGCETKKIKEEIEKNPKLGGVKIL
jgi:ribosomal protein L18E